MRFRLFFKATIKEGVKTTESVDVEIPGELFPGEFYTDYDESLGRHKFIGKLVCGYVIDEEVMK